MEAPQLNPGPGEGHDPTHQHAHAHGCCGRGERAPRVLPAAGRPGYRVIFRGRNVLAAHPLHRGELAQVGFWATCHVEAPDERAAERAAFKLLFEDDELRAAVRNEPGHPPVVDLEDVEELEALPPERLRYEWFADARGPFEDAQSSDGGPRG
ncbi:MAG: hypothetical protein AB7N76_07780 [Planctomycetota bacterium]